MELVSALHTCAGNVTEADFKSEAAILRERQLVLSAKHLGSFCHNNAVLPSKMQPSNQPPILFT
jgi:hypothetical protein